MSKHSGLLFIGFVVVAAIALIVFLQKNTDQTSTTTNTNTVNTNLESRSIDEVETVSADGTFTLLQSANKTEVGEIVTYRFENGNSLSIMPVELKTAVLNETPVQSESEITVGNVSGKRYILSSAKDGSLFPIVQLTQGSKLYDFRGSEDYLDNLESYISFTNNQ